MATGQSEQLKQFQELAEAVLRVTERQERLTERQDRLMERAEACARKFEQLEEPDTGGFPLISGGTFECSSSACRAIRPSRGPDSVHVVAAGDSPLGRVRRVLRRDGVARRRPARRDDRPDAFLAVAMTGALYTVGWRVRGQPRRWLVNHFRSLDEAVRVARGNVRFDGAGPVAGVRDAAGGPAPTARRNRCASGCWRRRAWRGPRGGSGKTPESATLNGRKRRTDETPQVQLRRFRTDGAER